MKKKFIIIFSTIVVTILFYSYFHNLYRNKSSLANPASKNCIEKGGKLKIKINPKGEYGICIFEDNKQCEEWALLRGECPAGGVKITGYQTEQAKSCAIIGGNYSEKSDSCTFKNKECSAKKLFSGECRFN